MKSYWSYALQSPSIADAMQRNRYKILSKFLHFVNNNFNHDTSDKLFKIRYVIKTVRNECIEIELEEYQAVDK